MKKIIILLFVMLSISISAAPFKIPADDLKGIKERVIKQHPNDYITQDFVIKLQKNAYISANFFKWDKRVSKKIREDIMYKAYIDHGEKYDFVTMLHVMKLQQKNYLKLL